MSLVYEEVSTIPDVNSTNLHLDFNEKLCIHIGSFVICRCECTDTITPRPEVVTFLMKTRVFRFAEFWLQCSGLLIHLQTRQLFVGIYTLKKLKTWKTRTTAQHRTTMWSLEGSHAYVVYGSTQIGSRHKLLHNCLILHALKIRLNVK